jgi:hypothetical protein
LNLDYFPSMVIVTFLNLSESQKALKLGTFDLKPWSADVSAVDFKLPVRNWLSLDDSVIEKYLPIYAFSEGEKILKAKEYIS